MSLEDTIFDSIPDWNQEKIRNAKVLVVGAGALGNEVLKNLALLNVRRLAIIDFDKVESSNLTRSIFFRQADVDQERYKAEVIAERLLELNPDLQILVQMGDVVTDLSLGLLREIDVVIGCVDNRLARLYLNRLCWRAGKPWIDGGILNLSGQVAAYRHGVACYECGLTTAAWAEIRQRQGCTDMARRYAMAGHAPTTPLAASIIGAMQVQEALKLVLGLDDQSLLGKMFSIEGAYNMAAVYEQRPLRANCESHFQLCEAIDAPLSADSTVDALMAFLRQSLGMQKPSIHLDHSVITALVSMETGRGEQVILPLPKFSDRIAAAFAARHGAQMAVPKGGLIEEIGPDSGYGSWRLCDFGIPYGHELRVGRGAERQLIALAADRPMFAFEKSIKHLTHRSWEADLVGIRLHLDGF